jgi:hypothetical protein
LNTFIPPVTVSRTRVHLISMLLTALVTASTLPHATSSSIDEDEFATLLDVIIFDAACTHSSTPCEGQRIQHLVEYYGADWCEPCELIENEIDLMNRSDTFVLQHHPSVADESFLSASKLRFETEHRLLFIPSIVIDGQGLLTGSSQGLELSNALSLRSTNFSGLSNVSLSNGNLTWSALGGDTVSVWTTEATAHPNRNRTHPNLATGMMAFNSTAEHGNISAMMSGNEVSIVVVLEKTGTYRLVTDSQNPTGGIDVYDGNTSNPDSSIDRRSPGLEASIWTVILILSLLPAIYMRWSISKQSQPAQEEE